MLILLFLLFQPNGCHEKENLQVQQIAATSYIVLQQSNNKILQGNNYDTCKSVAFISKIMTAIIVIENSNVNELVKVPKEIKTADGSSIYLKENQEISRLDLLNCSVSLCNIKLGGIIYVQDELTVFNRKFD